MILKYVYLYDVWLVLNRNQTCIWTNADDAYWRPCALLNLNVKHIFGDLEITQDPMGQTQ